MASPVTELLNAASLNPSALERVVALLYQELRGLARARLRGDGSNSLNPTALVHECFERMRKAGSVEARSRVQFLAYASSAMRSVVVDHARRRSSQRRGGDQPHVPLDEEVDGVARQDDELLRVHEALEELGAHDERLRRVVELRYFGGLTELEIAEVLGVTDRTVRRDWEKARLLLYAVLG